jgi:hypothetical protein
MSRGTDEQLLRRYHGHRRAAAQGELDIDRPYGKQPAGQNHEPAADGIRRRVEDTGGAQSECRPIQQAIQPPAQAEEDQRQNDQEEQAGGRQHSAEVLSQALHSERARRHVLFYGQSDPGGREGRRGAVGSLVAACEGAGDLEGGAMI